MDQPVELYFYNTHAGTVMVDPHAPIGKCFQLQHADYQGPAIKLCDTPRGLSWERRRQPLVMQPQSYAQAACSYVDKMPAHQPSCAEVSIRTGGFETLVMCPAPQEPVGSLFNFIVNESQRLSFNKPLSSVPNLNRANRVIVNIVPGWSFATKVNNHTPNNAYAMIMNAKNTPLTHKFTPAQFVAISPLLPLSKRFALQANKQVFQLTDSLRQYSMVNSGELRCQLVLLDSWSD